MRYEPGDKVRVTECVKRMPEVVKEYYDVTQKMTEYARKVFTVEWTICNIDGGVDFVTLKEDEYKYEWDTDLLEPIKYEGLTDELAKTKNRMKCLEEDNEILKEKLRRLNNNHNMLLEYYEKLSFSLEEVEHLAQENEHLLDKLASTGKTMARLEKDNMELRRKCSMLEGKLDRAKSILNMLTGREF